MADFVKRSAPILKDTTCGYGLWVYRNYVNDCVYNGQFALGLTGWDTTGNVEKTEHDRSKAVSYTHLMYPMLWEARGVNKKQLIDDLINHAFKRYER